MDSGFLIVSVLVSIYLIVNICLVPMQMRYLRSKREEKVKELDVNKRHENQSFEQSQLEYNQQAGILFPSLLMASLVLYLKERKHQ